MSCVYRHVRLDTNQVFYVGVGSNMLRPYHTFGRNSSWYEITKLYPYRVDILMDDLTNEDAIAKEREFILLYGREDLGTGTLVNRNAGGQSGITGPKNLSKENIERLRLQAKVVFTRPDVRAKIAAAQKGMKKSKAHAQKISEATKGRVLSEATKKKLSDFRMGHVIPIEQRVRHSITNFKNAPKYIFKNPPNPDFKSSYFLIQVDPFTGKELARFDFIHQCAYDNGYRPSAIRKAIRKNGCYAGFMWRKEPRNV